MTIQQTLKKTTKKFKIQNISSADLDAEVLLLEALNKNKSHSYNNINDIKHGIATSPCGAPRNDSNNLDKSWLYINNKYILSEKEEKLFNDFIKQRIKHKPVAYITNKKEFYGYNFYVDENVLIPRPETEIIVEEVLKIINEKKDFKNKINLIDIGTGSGCIVISILNELIKNKKDKVIHNAYANDISAKAIKVAKINTGKYNLNKKIKFTKDDLEKFLSKKNIYNSDEFIITANLPYIKNDDYKNLAEDVKKYEPQIALVAGEDGLACIEKLIYAIEIIRSGSESESEKKITVFIEADPDQISEINALFKRKFNDILIKIIKDLSQKERIISIEIS